MTAKSLSTDGTEGELAKNQAILINVIFVFNSINNCNLFHKNCHHHYPRLRV